MFMRRLLIFLGLIWYSPFVYAEVYFNHQCEQHIVELIRNSQTDIDVAVYSINNNNIINSLEDAKKRGVTIRILTDRLQAFGKSSKVALLHDKGFNIKVNSHNKIMHDKFAIFDKQKAIAGSFNWTYAAANKNAEDCVIINNQNDISVLENRFNELWRINSKDVSECYITNMILEKDNRINCNV